jgi:hypothetical protein
MEKIKQFIEHPATNLIIAIVLVGTSLAEGWESFSGDLSEFRVGAHHGVLLLGVAMLIKSIIEALESIIRAHERRR